MKPQKTKDLDTLFKKKGFLPQERDHTYYLLYYKNKKTSVFTKISHGLREYGDKLLSQMAKELSLTNSEFEDLVGCPLTYDKLIEKLIERNRISY